VRWKEKSRKTRCRIPNINGNLADSLVLNEFKQIISKNPPLLDANLIKALVESPESTTQSDAFILQNKIAEMDAAC
jgi:hypothetical protein